MFNAKVGRKHSTVLKQHEMPSEHIMMAKCAGAF